MKEIGLELDDNAAKLWCDNTQTIGLVTKEIATLQTKLRHVDIHNHWLREAVKDRRIRVNYAPNKEMLADDLTKALSEEAFVRFRDQIGVVDITADLNTRNARMRDDTITEEDIQALEHLIDGGEEGIGPE